MDLLNSCRCCLQAAPDLDLTTPYTHLDKTEIYADMLTNCFDLHLTQTCDGPCGICFTCVGRLRDTSNFKLQVQRCQVELQTRLQGASHVEYEKVIIKVEMENDGSEEAVSHEEPVIMKSETVSKDETADNVCEDTLVKLECSDGVHTFNEDAMSSGSDPLDSATGAEMDPALPTSHDELNILGHKSDESDSSEGHTEEYSSDISEEQDMDQQRYPCGLCGKDFVNKSALKRHQRVIHATEKMYVCEYCNKKFTTKDYLDKHKNTHVGEESFSCDVCDEVYKKKSHLNSHKIIHVGRKQYKCEKCNKSFARKCYLEQHQIKYCKQKYVCEVCNKEFAKKMVLIRHVSIHSGTLPYECSECAKRFSRKDLLNAHKKIHSGMKAYSCEECEKQFFNKRNLLRHKMTHSGQKYECTVCNKSYIREDYLKAHQKIHTGGKPAKKLEYTCKNCNKQFLSKTDLSRHARIHTGEKPFACEACHKKFNQKTHLATHLKSCMKHLGIQ